MQGHMMHCGAVEVPQAMLLQTETPEPTDTHHPIAHHSFFELGLQTLHNQGYTINNPKHFLNREGAHYFSMMELYHPDMQTNGSNSTLCALRNSHDKTFSASLAIGSRVFVCDNLAFSGDVTIARKHTTNIWVDLPEMFEFAVAKIASLQKKQEVRFAEYKRAPLDDATADYLIMESYRRGIINLKRIGKVDEEWRNPSADHGDKSIWRYMNAVTAALRPASTNQLIQLGDKTIKLNMLLDKFCDVDVDDSQEDWIDGEVETRMVN